MADLNSSSELKRWPTKSPETTSAIIFVDRSIWLNHRAGIETNSCKGIAARSH